MSDQYTPPREDDPRQPGGAAPAPGDLSETNVDDEALVAYLDGELDAETAQRVEAVLTQDETARVRLRELQSSWDLLDDLPRAEVSEAFTHSTVSMIAVRLSEESARDARKWWYRARWILAVAGAVLAAAAGYWTVDSLTWAPNRNLLRDLPVIENIDMYQTAGSVEFLRLLAQEGLFEEEDATHAP